MGKIYAAYPFCCTREQQRGSRSCPVFVLFIAVPVGRFRYGGDF
jgi:hypothetical protein